MKEKDKERMMEQIKYGGDYGGSCDEVSPLTREKSTSRMSTDISPKPLVFPVSKPKATAKHSRKAPSKLLQHALLPRLQPPCIIKSCHAYSPPVLQRKCQTRGLSARKIPNTTPPFPPLCGKANWRHHAKYKRRYKVKTLNTNFFTQYLGTRGFSWCKYD